MDYTAAGKQDMLTETSLARLSVKLVTYVGEKKSFFCGLSNKNTDQKAGASSALP